MPNLAETSVWEPGVYQIETTDPVLGGAPNPATGAGMSNIPHLQLARRTLFLRDQVDALQASLIALSASLGSLASQQRLIAPVLVATTANITLTGLQTIDGVSVTAGRRVLVKNQTTQSQNGVYIAGTGPWLRAEDFNDNGDVLPGCAVAVTSGTTQADTLWVLSSPNEGDAIVIGTTPLVFSSVNAGVAPLASPAFTGSPTGPTAAQFNSSQPLATTEFVQRALGNFAGNVGYTVNGAIPAGNAGLRGVWTPATAGALTLPAIATVAIGASFYIAAGGADVTIAPNGAEVIFRADNVSIGTISLSQGEDVVVTRGGAGWAITGGSLRLGNYRDAVAVGAGQTLTAQDAGRCFVYGGTTPITLTLPSLATVMSGGVFEFINAGTAGLTVQRAGSDQIDNGPSAVNSIVVPPNQSLKLVRASGSTLWHPVSLTAVAQAALGASKLWQTVTRAVDTNFQNTNPHPLEVMAKMLSTDAATWYIDIGPTVGSYVERIGNSHPTSSGHVVTAFFTVPPGWFYRWRRQSTAITVDTWSERSL